VLDAKTYAKLFEIDCNQFSDSVSNMPRSIAVNGNNMYVGTFGSEIWKMTLNIAKKSATNPQVMIRGHYSPLRKDNNEAWGLAIFPKDGHYVTVSDDSTLRIWDAIKHVQVSWVNLKLGEGGAVIPVDPVTNEASHGCQGRSVDVNPKGDKIAVGMRDNTFRVYSVSANLKDIKLTFVSKKLSKGEKEWVEDLKFSPDGTKLAVGSHDNAVYIFDANTMKQLKVCKSSTSFITHLDWSLDSQSIRTNDGSYEVLYYNVNTGLQDKNGVNTLRDEPWATQTCTFTWGTLGIWQSG
jgi:microtubule-associated protein-like 6